MIVLAGSKACDFVTRVPVQYLVEQGIKVIGLYLKYWNLPYVDECERAGICVIPIWEISGSAALEGAAKGHSHGRACSIICGHLGIPEAKSIIVAHDTGIVTDQVGWYLQAFDTELHPWQMSGYWSLKARQQAERVGVVWDVNWTPAARSWGQDPEAELRQFPSGPFPGHPEYNVDMGTVQFSFDYYNPYTAYYNPYAAIPVPPTIPLPPMKERAMTTVFNNKEATVTDDNGLFDGQPNFDPSTAKSRIIGEVKWRLMEDGSLRHLRIVEYANMAIIRETAMTSGDLMLFPIWKPLPVNVTQTFPHVILRGEFSGEAKEG